jgi:hypothetical protein
VAASPDFDLSAASLRAGGAELDGVVQVLAEKLESALPGQTHVRRRGRRALSRERRVSELEVNLGSCFRLEADRSVRCWREKIVGGVTIKREPLELGDWLRALTEELDASSEATARARTELERLLI